MPEKKKSGALRKAQEWLGDQLVEAVPDDIAFCEFDCQKLECRTGHWINCKRRLAFVALKEKNEKARLADQDAANSAKQQITPPLKGKVP